MLKGTWLATCCLCAAMVSAGAWAQPGHGDDEEPIGSGCNDQGEECYYGNCDGCEEDCSEETRTVDCKSSCLNNCSGDGATNCQDCCTEAVSATMKEQIGTPVTRDSAHRYQVHLLDRLNNGRELTHDQVVATEWLAAAADQPAIRRLALSLIVDAWVRDLVRPEDKAFIRGALEGHALGRDPYTWDTAYALIQEFDLRSVITDHLFAHVVKAARGGRHLREQIRRVNPDASDLENSERVTQRRNEARDMLRYILSN